MSENKKKSNVIKYGIIWGIIFLAGIIIWITTLSGQDDARAWRALLINFAFFTPLSAGMVVWVAIVKASNGNWMKPIEPLGITGIAFAIPSLLFLIILWIGSDHWASWVHSIDNKSGWLNNTYLFIRDITALIIFWAAAFWFIHRRNTEREIFSAGVLIVVYSAVFTLLAFDLIMALDPEWKSSLFGAYFFISGLYISITGLTFISLFTVKPKENVRHDLGEIIFAFSILTTYLMYCQLLPQYYENLPSETRFIVPRMNFIPWETVSFILIGLFYLGPLILLLTVWAKRTTWYLGLICFILLLVMWVERWWLIDASFQHALDFGWAEVSSFAAFAGLLGLAILLFAGRMKNFYVNREKVE
jgi:hypothetical protein